MVKKHMIEKLLNLLILKLNNELPILVSNAIYFFKN